MIYTTRNPKDSILSLYKLLLWFRQFDGVESPFKTFFDMFMKGEESKDFIYCKALIPFLEVVLFCAVGGKKKNRQNMRP